MKRETGPVGEEALIRIIDFARDSQRAGFLTLRGGAQEERFCFLPGRNADAALRDLIRRAYPLLGSRDLECDWDEMLPTQLCGLSAETSESSLRELRFAILDVDEARAKILGTALTSQGAKVALCSRSSGGLQRARTLDPEIILVPHRVLSDSAFQLLSRVRKDLVLRWASILWVPDADTRLAPLALAKRIAAGAETVLGVDRELEESVLGDGDVSTRLEKIGPSRLLRGIGRAIDHASVHVEGPAGEVQIELSPRMIAGASGESGPRQFQGIEALSALLALDEGDVRISTDGERSLSNVMMPFADAFATALGMPSPIPSSTVMRWPTSVGSMTPLQAMKETLEDLRASGDIGDDTMQVLRDAEAGAAAGPARRESSTVAVKKKQSTLVGVTAAKRPSAKTAPQTAPKGMAVAPPAKKAPPARTMPDQAAATRPDFRPPPEIPAPRSPKGAHPAFHEKLQVEATKEQNIQIPPEARNPSVESTAQHKVIVPEEARRPADPITVERPLMLDGDEATEVSATAANASEIAAPSVQLSESMEYALDAPSEPVPAPVVPSASFDASALKAAPVPDLFDAGQAPPALELDDPYGKKSSRKKVLLLLVLAGLVGAGWFAFRMARRAPRPEPEAPASAPLPETSAPATEGTPEPPVEPAPEAAVDVAAEVAAETAEPASEEQAVTERVDPLPADVPFRPAREGARGVRGRLNQLIRAGNYHRRHEDLQMAHLRFGQALEINPRNGRALAGAARIAASQNRLGSALVHARGLVENGSNEAANRIFLAGLLRQAGRDDEARAELQRVLELDPGNQDARAALEDLGG